MPQPKKVSDQNILVPTASYPEYAKYPFEFFNPLQSRIFDFYIQDCNAIVSAKTSAGKTICSEMLAAYQIRECGGKVAYLAPMKALAKEKYDDWTSDKHHFFDLKVSLCTGDYRLTPARKKEIEESNIVILTSEMLNARCRNMNSEQNEWLKDLKLVIVDESHLLTVPGRGDHLEVGLMNLTSINRSVRLVLLSATMPNVSEIAEWVSYVLTGKETYLLESEYRPCPLGIHYETYDSGGKYEDQEMAKIAGALDIVNDHPDDKFLLFVHTKRTGEMLKKQMEAQGKKCQFHSADLEKKNREKLENDFRSGDLKYLIATSTLAWGINSPARRVVILGVHRGLSEVETYDIWQMAGRAGRPGYDPRGDVYILLPDAKEEKHRDRLRNPQRIESKLLESDNGEHFKTLAFHLVSEIHHGRIKTKDDVHEWYNRTLAHFQTNGLDDSIVDKTLDLLVQKAAIKLENGIYKVTSVGMISRMFYYSPFDVADLRRNFMTLFKTNREDNDLFVSIALGNVDSIRGGIISKAERADMEAYQNRIWREFGKEAFLETAIKGGFAYYVAMTGGNPGAMGALMRNIQWDFPRLIQVLDGLDTFGCKWDKGPFFKDLQSRVLYGVKSELVPFVKLPDIGKVRAERMWNVGFRNLNDIVSQPDLLRTTLNLRAEKILEIVEAAKSLILIGD